MGGQFCKKVAGLPMHYICVSLILFYFKRNSYTIKNYKTYLAKIVVFIFALSYLLLVAILIQQNVSVLLINSNCKSSLAVITLLDDGVSLIDGDEDGRRAGGEGGEEGVGVSSSSPAKSSNGR